MTSTSLLARLVQAPRLSAVWLATLALGALAQGAGEPAKPGAPTTNVNSAEARYESAASPLATEQWHRSNDQKAPPITEADFARARQIYFERCAGCHGVLRKGATGKPLTPDITLEKGTDYLKVFIAYGSPAGMPNWLTSGEMNVKEVDLMARYIQQDPPTPPEFGMEQMKATWKVLIPPEQRPTKIGRASCRERVYACV